MYAPSFTPNFGLILTHLDSAADVAVRVCSGLHAPIASRSERNPPRLEVLRAAHCMTAKNPQAVVVLHRTTPEWCLMGHEMTEIELAYAVKSFIG